MVVIAGALRPELEKRKWDRWCSSLQVPQPAMAKQQLKVISNQTPPDQSTARKEKEINQLIFH